MKEVLLKKDVENLGKRGEVVKVADGYARNYLFPKNLATTVTPENIRLIELEKVRMVQEEMMKLEEFKALAARLESISCTIEAKASEEGHLYGSVNPQMIAEALEKEGIELDPKAIKLENPVKELGIYTIPIQLHPEVQASTKIWVVEEK